MIVHKKCSIAYLGVSGHCLEAKGEGSEPSKRVKTKKFKIQWVKEDGEK